MPDESLETPKHGRIVTFYSYKGGTGRTMALANVAFILASNGYRVLVADWDLESPGLHRFFSPFLDQTVPDAPGIIDMVRDYEYLAKTTSEEKWQGVNVADYTQIKKYVIPLKHYTFPEGGSLEFLSPGKQNRDYLTTLSGLDWDHFYEMLNGSEFLNALRDEMKAYYDYTLIDSRTGLSDVADVCTVNLPDVLVDCFTLSTQGIEGSASVARIIEDRYGYRGIRVLPVPMRVDLSELDRVNASRTFAQRRFENLPSDLTPAERQDYWAMVEVPYQAYYSYEETLAVFRDMPRSPGSMLSAYERITSYITDGVVTSLPPIDEDLRSSIRAKFERKPPLENKQLTIEFLPEDQLWVDWISAVLTAGEFTVLERRLRENGRTDEADGSRTLTVVSEAYIAWRRHRQGKQANVSDSGSFDLIGQPGAVRPGFAVYVVSGPRSLPEFATASSAQLATARSEAEAVDRLERLFRIATDPEDRAAATPRYPGTEPRVLRGLAARNERFTGRENDLGELRDELRGTRRAVVRPLTLLGTAGVGKTAIALEYAHRFMNDYDLVCWIPCGQSEEVDLRVAELLPALRDRFGISPPPGESTVAERARMVLDVLADGETVPRWLLIYDNAEDIGTIREYLPSSGGQVLITSQNKSWEEHNVRTLQVRMFDRQESVAHLSRVVPSLTGDEADALADALGDLPVAVTAVAVYLRDSGYPVARYLSDLEQRQPSAPSVGVLSVYPREVAGAWDAPLRLLKARSEAAARLLELCSVMASDIATELVHSRAMAEVLEPFDPALAAPLIMGRIVQEASKLNLLTIDAANKQITVHRVVQTVVRSRMSAAEVAAARAEVQQILLAARPRRDVDDPEARNRFRMIWPHLGPAEVVSSTDERVRELIIDRIRYIYVYSDYARGVAEATAAVAEWQEMLNSGLESRARRSLHTQLLQLQFNLGLILLAQSKFTESRKLHAQVLEEQTELLKADHPYTLMTAGSLAADLRALGLYQNALELDRQTHPAWVALYGDDNLWSLRSANNLAVSFRLNGDVNAALQLDRETYQRTLSTLGNRHRLTLSSHQNLARDLLECGEYRAAVDTARHAYRLAAEHMGPDSSPALDGQVLLGIALRSSGHPDEAEPQFEQALDPLRTRFGDAASATLAARLSLGVNLWSLDRFAEAEAEMCPVFEQYQESLEPDHPHALVCQVNLAALMRQKLDSEKAAKYIAAALAGLERVLGPAHPYTLAAETVHGVLLADQKDLGQAVHVETRTLGLLTSTLGPTHPDTLRCHANLLLTRRDRGEDTAAELERVIDQLETPLGADHPTVKTLRKRRRLLRALDPQPF
jgi:MinD-like ATPase involved in chromosome partitioning or flagellar assembly